MKKRWITKANIKKTAFVVAGCVAMGCVATFSTGDSDSVVPRIRRMRHRRMRKRQRAFLSHWKHNRTR